MITNSACFELSPSQRRVYAEILSRGTVVSLFRLSIDLQMDYRYVRETVMIFELLGAVSVERSPRRGRPLVICALLQPEAA